MTNKLEEWCDHMSGEKISSRLSKKGIGLQKQKEINKLIKKKKVTPSWCGTCLRDLGIRYSKLEKTKFILLYGYCHKCKKVFMLRILKDKELFAIDYIPKKDRYKYSGKSTEEMKPKQKEE